MNEPPELHVIIRQWVAKAEEDIVNADHTLTMDFDCPLGTVCFHAQQCAEKYIKALLIWHSIAAPRTHDIMQLVRLLPPVLSIGQKLPDRLGDLTQFAVDSRYPGPLLPVSRDEAAASVEMARVVRDCVRSHLPPECL